MSPAGSESNGRGALGAVPRGDCRSPAAPDAGRETAQTGGSGAGQQDGLDYLGAADPGQYLPGTDDGRQHIGSAHPLARSGRRTTYGQQVGKRGSEHPVPHTGQVRATPVRFGSDPRTPYGPAVCPGRTRRSDIRPCLTVRLMLFEGPVALPGASTYMGCKIKDCQGGQEPDSRCTGLGKIDTGCPGGPEPPRRARGGQVAMRCTVMSSCFAFSTRFSMMPEPGNAITPFARRSQSGLPTTWRTPLRSVQLAAIFSMLGPPPCTSVMSAYFSRALSRRSMTAARLAMSLPLAMAPTRTLRTTTGPVSRRRAPEILHALNPAGFAEVTSASTAAVPLSPKISLVTSLQPRPPPASTADRM